MPKAKVSEKVARELPFLAFEKAMMLLTKHGANRQEAHAKIQQVTHKFKELQDKDEKAVVELSAAMEDAYFDKVCFPLIVLLILLLQVRDDVLKIAQNPLNFTGSCVRQVRDFLAHEFRPAVAAYVDKSADGERSHLDV